jgi:phosphocarrier protein HPr
VNDSPCRTVLIVNDLGIHLRAAGALVQLAGRFRADIWIERNDMKVNGKSIMSVLSLAASKGTEVTISAQGEDAEQAVDALCQLIERGFEGNA